MTDTQVGELPARVKAFYRTVYIKKFYAPSIVIYQEEEGYCQFQEAIQLGCLVHNHNMNVYSVGMGVLFQSRLTH